MCGFVGYVEDGEKDRKIIKNIEDQMMKDFMKMIKSL